MKHTKEQFQERKYEITKERDIAKERFEEAESKNDEWLAKVQKELDLVHGIESDFRDGTIKEKKYIFSEIGSNFIFKDGKLAVEAKRQFILFKELQCISDVTFEPKKELIRSYLNDDLKDTCPSWL